ncbi:MAG: SMC family ATPase [Chloroflexota bacterium]
MIPLHLRISGFLSYRDPAELDFTGFDLACISGPNGAGKSTLLDAITWALFGQARRRDEALINLQSDAAEVAFTFRYEDTDYRILRSLRRGRAGSLEFQIRQSAVSASTMDQSPEAAWKPLTERTQKETQARIEQVLRLDYDTFVNASFFLQGKADLFAQQTPARRKDVLSNILGMEIWEAYKARAADMRRRREAELASVVGRLGEIGAELSEEAQRTQFLAQLQTQLTGLVAVRKSQASALEAARRTHAVLEQERMLLAEQTAVLDRSRADLAALQSRLADRKSARLENSELTQRADEIESTYASWRASMADLERWDGIARAFRDQEVNRAPLLQEVAAEQARLAQERSQLISQQAQVQERSGAAAALESELEQASAALAEAQTRLEDRDALQVRLASERESMAEKTAENRGLKAKMDEIKLRLETLKAASGATCPLCGQALSGAHRRSTLDTLEGEGRQHGDQYRSNSVSIQDLRASAADLESRLAALAGIDESRLAHSRSVARLSERLGALRSELINWENTERGRLEDVTRILDGGEFALEARAKLASLDAALARLGYDATAHDAARLTESGQRAADQLHTQLQSARAALAPLENEIRNLESNIAERAAASARQESELRNTHAALEAAGADLPDLAQVERAVFELQEQENRLNQDVGAARQKVVVLDDLRERSGELESVRQSLALNIGRHRMLESAFGKDGVPALLIEQALPEVESRANEILDRLSDGRMSVHFETQAAYRDPKRDDLRETLDIKISDGAGKRDYEMYSGGEAFRVNFAIRLALSQVLAGRKGARLQTLVIDEGFGSQDTQGRQRLIETINLVRHDFAKILLISHLDELKDAFPTRIEVEKTERGSILSVN